MDGGWGEIVVIQEGRGDKMHLGLVVVRERRFGLDMEPAAVDPQLGLNRLLI